MQQLAAVPNAQQTSRGHRENIVVTGVTYRHVPVATLGARALAKDSVTTRLPQIAAEIDATEIAYLGTCNRIAFVIVGSDSAEVYRDRLARLMDLPLRAWQGDGAIEHLLLVASGLQSARRGEPEIRNQVRGAWTTARAAGTSGAILDRLFTEVLKTAAEVQRHIATSIGVVSLSDGALERLHEHLDGRVGSVAVIGVSAMTRRCAVDLAARGHNLIVASRTRDSAIGLAAEVNGQARTLDELHAGDQTFDAVIAAAGGGAVVAAKAEIARWTPGTGLLAIDFGVPPNIAPEADDLPGVTLLDMDRLIELARDGGKGHDGAIGAAREIVDHHLDRLKGEAALRQAAPAIEGVVRHHQALVRASLAEIDPTGADPAALSAWADRMSRRFLHATLVGVRALATEAGPAAVESFLRGLHGAVPSSGDPEEPTQS